MNSITASPETSKPIPAHPALTAIQRYVPLLVVILVLGSILFSAMKIIGYGYLPPDDALRHAGKAVSGKPWDQIMVIRPGFGIDHNYGWHVLLTGLHQALNWDADTLVSFSVAGLLILFCVAPLLWLRRPEAWLAALFGYGLYGSLLRMTLGRPFILDVAIFLVLLMLWRQEQRAGKGRLIGATLLFALGGWVHGAWFLFALPILAFLLAGRVRASLELAGCWLTGTMLGASLTGHPVEFIVQAVRILFSCLSHNTLQRMLVTELQPSGGTFAFIVIVAFALVLRQLSGRAASSLLKDPIFIMGALGWFLGLRVVRFWDDWGGPALCLWLALELQQWMVAKWPSTSLARLVAALFLAGGFVITTTNDSGGRWTNNLTNEYLVADNPELAGWLPEKGGVFYSADMRLFYQTFFKNPHADWRYILGFEPTFMPVEDLAVYRKIQWNYGETKAFMPWVKKMRPADRLAIHKDASQAPDIKELEWHCAGGDLWLGRLPKTALTKPEVQPLAAPPGS